MKKLLALFTFALVAFAANAQSTLKGDVNGDGEVSVTDIAMIVKYILGVEDSNFIIDNADTNGDGEIDIYDVNDVVLVIVSYEGSSYKECPDSRHPHRIDLGLPSGTKWSCCNVGADKPEECGGYFAWGETYEKSLYDWSTYIHSDGDYVTCHDLGSDIAGTKYDVAHVKWGGSWVMPSIDQNQELIENCNSEWTIVNGVNGRKFTSKINGGSIFLPAVGYRWYDSFYNVGSFGTYWSSTQDPSESSYACYLNFHSGNVVVWDIYYGRYYGRSVRPVSR